MQNNHLPYLDGWRGLAIVFLLVGHFFPVPGIDLSTFGVALFFVLSGLLMSKILFLDNVPIATFYRRRISRIFPALFAFMIVVMLVYAATGKPIIWPEVLTTATVTTNYFQSVSHSQMPFGHIWSLSVEEHSYILLSALAAMVRLGYIGARAAVGYFVALFACMTLIYFALAPADLYLRVRQTEVAALAIFASGWLMIHHSRTVANWGALAAPVMLFAALALQWWSVPGLVRVIGGCCALAIAINLLSSAHPKFLAALSFRPLRQMGLWSFSIYLWQQPFTMMQGDGLSSLNLMATGVACGITSYYLVERPARAYLNSRRSAASIPASVSAINSASQRL